MSVANLMNSCKLSNQPLGQFNQCSRLLWPANDLGAMRKAALTEFGLKPVTPAQVVAKVLDLKNIELRRMSSYCQGQTLLSTNLETKTNSTFKFYTGLQEELT